MAKKRHGLGKGLGALIPENTTKNVSNDNYVSINFVKPNKEQPRKNFDEEKIIELSESIKEHGIIQPIVVKKEEEFYKIVAGERRWRAAKKAGLKEVPIVEINLSDKEVLEVSLIENIQREDLNPIEEAIAYKKLLNEFDITQIELSTRIGKSRTAITNCMRLINLDDRVQEYLIDGVISEGHGRTLLGVDNKEWQYKLAQKIIDESLSVRETEKIIKDMNKEEKSKKEIKNDKVSIFYQDIEGKLQDLFNTKVKLNHKKNNKGKISIEYYSQEDLQRILDLLNI